MGPFDPLYLDSMSAPDWLRVMISSLKSGREGWSHTLEDEVRVIGSVGESLLHGLGLWGD